MKEKEKVYEITVYNKALEEIIFERFSNSFAVAIVEPTVTADGKLIQDVFLMTDNLHPAVTANICLALVQRDPQAKEIFSQAFRNLEQKGEL